MPAQKLDGKALAATMRAEMAAIVADRIRTGRRPPGLAVILIGDNPASHAYVRNKRKACTEVGMASQLHHLPAELTQSELLSLIAKLNADPEVHGLLIQLPLPPQIDEGSVIRAVDPHIDVDCFHPENVGLLAAGHPRFLPCTPFGVIELLRRNGIDPAGREVVIVGRSNIVGKPLAMMMVQKRSRVNPAGCDATVTVAHTRTPDLAAVCRRADVLIAAAGKPKLITPDMVKPGAAVVDVGTNAGPDGKLIGDVDPAVADVAGWLSPVPGGVGPMTITMLLANTLRAAETLDG
ncbi:MAG: bifunctional methylenetetrahydrofolate dehydrogenase/methenyltetrahydrofolate cyclohydrolase FolD [Fimbriiglobus sp.]